MAVSQKSKLILNIQDSLRFTVTADDSLGPGFAVRGNGKKRGEIAKKKNFRPAKPPFPFSRLPPASLRSPISL